MFELAPEGTKTQPMRDAIAKTLVELGKTNQNILVLDADLLGASGLKMFQDAYPDRTFDCGIQEGNMIGVAAGASECGLIPITHTFSSFAGRKCIDQDFISTCYACINVKMLGSEGGITATTNGGTHQGLEDMGLFRSIPNITLVEFSDAVMAAALLPEIVDTYGTVYMRQWRRCDDAIYQPGASFKLGKGNVLVDGKDATIIASGVEVIQSLKAAKVLEAAGISARVVDMFTWKPLDEELVSRCAAETGCIVTAENHEIATGLGQAIAAYLAKTTPTPMGFIGVNERYGEVGNLPYLLQTLELSAEHIAAKVKETIKRK